MRSLPNSLMRHPRWRDGWRVRKGPPHVILNAARVSAVDASGAEFGFVVFGAGWPEMADKLAEALGVILGEQDTERLHRESE